MAKSADRCAYCDAFVKPENLPNHLRKAHGKSEEADRIRRSRQAPPRRARRALPVWSLVFVGLVVAGVALAAYWGSQSLSFGSPPGGNPPGGETSLTEMCVQHTGQGVHWHASLQIELLGQPYTIPANIGVTQTCMRPLHTHDASGTIHIEMPSARNAYLRDFFAVWGQPFSSTQIMDRTADGTHEVVLYVGGARSTEYGSLLLQDGQDILISYQLR